MSVSILYKSVIYDPGHKYRIVEVVRCKHEAHPLGVHVESLSRTKRDAHYYARCHVGGCCAYVVRHVSLALEPVG